MKKPEIQSNKRATSIKNKVKQPKRTATSQQSNLKLPEINLNLVKNKSASTRFQSQSPNPSRKHISDCDFEIKGKNATSSHGTNFYVQFEKADHRVRNINAWVSSYRDNSKGHIKTKMSAKKLFSKEESIEPFKTKLSTSFSALNSDGTDKEDMSEYKVFSSEVALPRNEDIMAEISHKTTTEIRQYVFIQFKI